MENMEIWNSLNRPPPSALKTIGFGPLKGKSDISPQWRMQAMTERFGSVGFGWKYDIVNLWTEPAAEGQVFAFSHLNLYWWMGDGGWSEPIPGVGGKLLLRQTKNGLESNDEAFKMAVTDAMGVAMKALGVAADIYAGLWDGSKYLDEPTTRSTKKTPPPKFEGNHRQNSGAPTTDKEGRPTQKQKNDIRRIAAKDHGMSEPDIQKFIIHVYGDTIENITGDQAEALLDNMNSLYSDYTGSQV